MSSVESKQVEHSRAGFFKRLAAMIYDTLVAVAVGMCAALVIIVLLTVLLETGILSKQGYDDVSQLIQSSFEYKMVIQIWVSVWIIAFFLWFWKHGGQTIGMRAWRLRLYSMNENPVGYGRLCIRLATSLLGLGTLLSLVDIKSKLALQDRASQIEVLCLSKRANDHKSW